MINTIDIVNRNQLFITPDNARGYQMKLVRCMFKTDTGDACLPEKLWKSLLLDVPHAKTVNGLKGSLDKFIYKKSIIGY